MKTKLLKFGFEIEGEYSRAFTTAVEQTHLGGIKGDGSVNRCNSGMPGYDFHLKHEDAELDCREFASTAFSVNGMKPVKELFNMYQKAYERGEYHWNRTAGFHIHTSYEPSMPFEIFSMRFYKYFMEAFKEKYPNEYELRKENRYCRANLTSRDLLRNWGRNDRYKAVNFIPALQRHGTVEFRIFPTAEPNKMFEYLLFTLELIQQYIDRLAGEKIQNTSNCYMPEDEVLKVAEIVVSKATIRDIKNQSDIIIGTKEKQNVQIIHS